MNYYNNPVSLACLACLTCGFIVFYLGFALAFYRQEIRFFTNLIHSQIDSLVVE